MRPGISTCHIKGVDDVSGQDFFSLEVVGTQVYTSYSVIRSYTTAHGLSSNAVYAIKGDGQDNLWISTNAGMSRFNLNTHTLSNFYADDGLQGNEFSKNASFADHNGILWFGGTNGII